MKHDRLLQEASKQAEEFKPQEIANTLWALATAGVQIPASLVECLSRRAESTAKEFNSQDIVNTLWAASVLETIPLFLSSALSWWNVLPDVALDSTSACQLHQFFLALQGDAPFDLSTFKRLEASLATISGAALLQHCCAEFTSGASKSTQSLLQRKIADTMRVVLAREYPRVQVLEEQVLKRGGGYSVDIQLVDGQIEGLGVVVEVDGPSHFLLRVDTDRSTLATNGSTRLKHRLLESMGWRV